MSKALSEAPITTATARAKLGIGEYAQRLDADAALWYRKGKRGGVWFARWRNYGSGAAYRQAPVGAANDVNDKQTEGTLTFLQAEAEARKVVAQARDAAKALADGPPLTVQTAVETYITLRDARDSKRAGRSIRSDAGQRLRRYVIGQPARGKQPEFPPSPLAAIPLHNMKQSDLLSWKAGLPDSLKATSRQRLVNDLKAALNRAHKSNHKRLPATLPGEIRLGLAAEDLEDDEAVSLARGNQILSDGEIARLLKAAREIDTEQDWEGDLFRIVLVLAATGARFSQIIRMRVGECQIDSGRLLVPVSRKGKAGRAKPKTREPLPVGRDVLGALVPITTDRPDDAPLFERWRHEQVAGDMRWHRVERGPWQSASELVRPWNAIRERAGMPEVVPYALRHTSIVRGITANLPIRLVAAAHDTSIAMIERHYAAWIVDGMEEMLRQAIVPLVPSEGGAEIVQLKSNGSRQR